LELEEMMRILEEVTTVISLFLRGIWGIPSPRSDEASQNAKRSFRPARWSCTQIAFIELHGRIM